ncbi:MAG: response regulator, partial [bacterium]
MKNRILLIDDDKGFAEAITKKLAIEGYEVDWAASGEEGLKKADSGDYAAVVLDYLLPGINGLETLERLKKQSPSMPVIFITAHGDH